MKSQTIKVLIAGLTVTVLSACGGGDSDGSSPSVAGPLAKYEGIWKDSCDVHLRETTTITASNNRATLALTPKDEYFDKTGCTGSVVATGTFGPPQPPLTVTYKETVANASVKLLTGQVIQTTVDRITAVGSGASMTYAGTGVTGPVSVGGKQTWRITYSGGSTDVQVDPLSGTRDGALMLQNGALLTLTPVGNSATSYVVESQLTR
jgi:hypothetical protein